MGQEVAKVKCPKCLFANPAESELCMKCRTPLPKVVFVDQAIQPPTGRPVQPADMNLTFRPGQVLADRYKILGIIGRGGMGCIYRVHDSILREDVALKTLLPQFIRDTTIVERFRNEARIARQLSHPNIVRVHDIAFSGTMLFISMEYIKGMSLRAQLDSLPPGERMPIKNTMRIMDQLCNALEYAHGFTVHRDIKPENVMIAEDGTVRLMDFGISKLMANSNLTATSMVMGTPHYMSPEQLRDSGAVDARADIYSVGVLLYEVLTGKLPVGMAKPASQIFSEVPPALDTIVSKCLEQDPAARYQSIAELREAMKPIYDLVVTGQKTTKHKGPAVSAETTESAKKLVGALLAASVFLGSIWFAMQIAKKNAAASESSGTNVIQQSAPDSFQSVATLVDRALAAARDRVGDDARRKSLLTKAENQWEEAKAMYKDDQDRAPDMARMALQTAVGLAMESTYENMVLIPSDSGKVTENAFLIDAYEVTNDAYGEFLNDAESKWNAAGTTYDPSKPDVPVTGVTVFDAIAYAAWRDATLPTESQWMRAAHTGELAPKTPYTWGEEWIDDAANVQLDASAILKPIGSHELDLASGCFDLGGNAAELTRTLFTDNPTTSSEKDGALENFTFGNPFVVRGGSYAAPAAPLEEQRYYQLYEGRNPAIGFRCVVELPSSLQGLQHLLDEATGTAPASNLTEPAAEN